MARPNEGKNVEHICMVCGNKFNHYLRTNHNIKYCSRKCYKSGCIRPADAIRRTALGNTGQKRTDEQRKHISAGEKRNLVVLERKRNRWLGELNPLWNGGISKSQPSRHYRTAEYKNWREYIFERDNYICQKCGVRGGTLHPHHIKSYSLFPSLRYEINNGMTLCVDCHHKLHGWRTTA